MSNRKNAKHKVITVKQQRALLLVSVGNSSVVNNFAFSQCSIPYLEIWAMFRKIKSDFGKLVSFLNSKTAHTWGVLFFANITALHKH